MMNDVNDKKVKTLPIIVYIIYCNALQWPFLSPTTLYPPPTISTHTLAHVQTYDMYILYYVIYLCYIVYVFCGKKVHSRPRWVCVCVCMSSHPVIVIPDSLVIINGLLRCTQNIWSYTMCCCYYYYYYYRRRCYKSCNDNNISLREYIYI